MPVSPSKPKKTPTTATRPTVPEAVKQLRLRLGLTQQAFATRLGLAISTVVRYESSRPPRTEALQRLYALALENRLDDVAEMFQQARLGELRGILHTGRIPLEDHERAITAALVAVLRNVKTLPEVRKPCKAALRAISAAYTLLEKRRREGAEVKKAHEDVASDELEAAIKRLNQVPREGGSK